MVLPLLWAGATIGAMYSVGRAYDNVRYWNDYKRNSGYGPKYPFLRGQFDYLGYGSSGVSGFGRGLKEL